jgi:hypothetical protein
MQYLEGSGKPVLYIGRTVLKGLGLPSGLFHSGFPTRLVYSFVFSSSIKCKTVKVTVFFSTLLRNLMTF